MTSSLPRLFTVQRVAIIAAVGAIGWVSYLAIERWQLTKFYGGIDNLALLREATEVTAWRLTPPLQKQPGVDRIAPQEYQAAGDGVELSRGAAYELQRLLTSPASYRFFSPFVTECGQPDYGVKFSFARGEETLEVYACLRCRELATPRADYAFGEADVSPAGAELLAIVQELFPEDAEIMSAK